MIKKSALRSHIELAVFSLLLFQSAPPLNASESDVVSRFSGDYRCTTENMGGFTHEKDGHKLSLFRPDRDYRLTHVGNLPPEAYMNRLDALEGMIKREAHAETGTYYLRTTDQPKSSVVGMQQGICVALGKDIGEPHKIRCENRLLGPDIFELDTSTGRFVATGIGSWHSKGLGPLVDSSQLPEGYEGDASYFVFGSCDRYFD
jgi:hypothetical protein